MTATLPMSSSSTPPRALQKQQQHQPTPSLEPAPSSSSSSASTSYTQSNPLHRRSSFPTSPNIELNQQGKIAAPCYFYLPPGLGLQLNGCGEGNSTSDKSSNATFSFDDGQGGVGVGVGVTSTTTPSSSRKSSSSSSSTTSTTSSSSSSVSSATTLASSLADSSPAAPAYYKRPAREPVPGEDPQLAAARRALWEEIPEPGAAGAPSPTNGVFEKEEEKREAVPEEDEEDDGDSYCSSDDEDSQAARSLPSHTTRPPLPSCLRPSLPSRTPSHSSSTTSPSPTSTTSVRISDAPPRAFTTFSPIDYERKGAAPVEKLSIREWIELQGVREAVGVWSGKIGKWEDGDLGASTASLEKVEVRETVSSETRERERISCGTLAAMVGVRTVSHNNSPVEPCRSLFD